MCCRVAWVWLLVFVGFASSVQADGKLAAVDNAPAGVTPAVAAALSPAGQQFSVDGNAVCTVWLVKEAAPKADFKPSLSVKYPFQPGHLIGVLRVDQKSEFTDFRGQDVAAGVYTLRYAQQPVDGNHVGTSELYDFLLALPAAADEDPAPLKSLDTLMSKSARVTGSNHPAIFSLVPPVATDKAPAAVHEESKEFWILSLSVAAPEGKAIPFRLVVVGESEG